MGSNRRYPDLGNKLAREREEAQAMREREPTSLTPAELDLGREPLTKTPLRRPVHAWVRYGERAVRVEGEVVAWTTRAVAVKWTTPDGAEHKAWLWNSAVNPR